MIKGRFIILNFILILGFVSAEKNNLPLNTTVYEKCKTELCVPKCCPEGDYLFGLNKRCYRRKSMKKAYNFSEVPIYNDNLEKTGRFLINNVTMVPGRILDEDFNITAFDYSSLNHLYYITENGFLYEDVPHVLNRYLKLNFSEYCVDYILPMKKLNIYKPMLKFFTQFPSSTETSSENDNPIIMYGLLTSCFFLALLLLVYALLHELRNLSGKVLMAYVASLLGSFFLLFLMLIGEHETEACKGLMYSIHYLILASFCWMNVMSCDIWWTFRGYAKARPIHRRGETFKFCMYCIYGFGLPAVLTSLVIVFNEIDMSRYRWFIPPNNANRCFFVGDGKLFYLYVPMLILIVCNWIFFLMTAFNIWRLHRATAVLDSAAAGTPAAHRSQKHRFLVYVKLSVIMGINWLLEILSFFSPNFKGWYISDVYNMLVGLSIFLIFVCKKQILRKLVKRLGVCNEWQTSRPSYSRSRSSNTTESDVSAEMPICVHPKGPAPPGFKI